MTYTAKKVVLITEKGLTERIATIIEACGATGYTLTRAGGKGSRDVRTMDQAMVADGFANIKIEVIVSDLEHAEQIAQTVADQYFNNYSGITYIEDVEILRPHKFQV